MWIKLLKLKLDVGQVDKQNRIRCDSRCIFLQKVWICSWLSSSSTQPASHNTCQMAFVLFQSERGQFQKANKNQPPNTNNHLYHHLNFEYKFQINDWVTDQLNLTSAFRLRAEEELRRQQEARERQERAAMQAEEERVRREEDRRNKEDEERRQKEQRWKDMQDQLDREVSLLVPESSKLIIFIFTEMLLVLWLQQKS